MIITDPWFYVIAIPAVLVYGIGKGGLGGAVGDIVVPFMALVISPSLAASILLPILIAMDMFAIHQHRGNVDWNQIRSMLPGGIAGIFIATISLKYLPEYGVEILIGAISIGFVLLYLLKRGKEQHRSGVLGALFWCGLGGFTSTAIHAGGGPISIYLLPQKLDKLRLIGTIAWFFAIINLIKLGAFMWLGGLNTNNMLTALILMPLAPIGVRLGVLLLNRISQQLVYRLCYLFLFLSGTKLFIDGLLQSGAFI